MEATNKKIIFLHILIAGLIIPFLLSLLAIVLLLIVPQITVLFFYILPRADVLFVIITNLVLPVIYNFIGIKISSRYLNKKYQIKNQERVINLSSLYYALITILPFAAIGITDSSFDKIKILMGVTYVVSFYLFTKKYFKN